MVDPGTSLRRNIEALFLGHTQSRLGLDRDGGSNTLQMRSGKDFGAGENALQLAWAQASGQEVDVVLEDRTGRVVGVKIKAAAAMCAVCRRWQPLPADFGYAEGCFTPARKSFRLPQTYTAYP